VAIGVRSRSRVGCGWMIVRVEVGVGVGVALGPVMGISGCSFTARANTDR
jgi:hypothetical protein